MTFLVVAIDVESPDIDLSTMLRGTARKFAPHITILPRVEATALRSRAVRGWGELLAAVERLRDEPLELQGPIRITDELKWYECAAGCRGRSALLDVHHLAATRLLDPGSRGPDPSFVGAGYRPHLTTTWHATGGNGALPRVLHVRAVGLVLYSYKSLPWAGAVQREALAGTTVANR